MGSRADQHYLYYQIQKLIEKDEINIKKDIKFSTCMLLVWTKPKENAEQSICTNMWDRVISSWWVILQVVSDQVVQGYYYTYIYIYILHIQGYYYTYSLYSGSDQVVQYYITYSIKDKRPNNSQIIIFKFNSASATVHMKMS